MEFYKKCIYILSLDLVTCTLKIMVNMGYFVAFQPLSPEILIFSLKFDQFDPFS